MGNSVKGILLIDRGIPENLSKEALKQYYHQILNNTFYTKGPSWLRKLLIQCFIIPMNLNQWYKKYRRFWSSNGFVGRFDIEQTIPILKRMLTQTSPKHKWKVELASIYGAKPIDQILSKMKSEGVQELLIIPLFPHWSQTSRGLVDLQIKKFIYKHWAVHYSVLEPFYNDNDVLHAQSELLNKALPLEINDAVAIVSAFRNELAQDISSELPICKKCLRTNDECRSTSPSRAQLCYRYQCFDSAQLINENCNLMYWNVAFHATQAQSSNSLGPSLKEVTEHLLEQGVTTIVVQCPSIIYSDIETLNDISFELREHFLNNGGKKFILVPPLGRSIHWISILQKIILTHLDEESLPQTHLENSSKSPVLFLVQ